MIEDFALCDRNCNDCPFMVHPNGRMITKILNQLHNKFGNEVYVVVETLCSNLTCCYDCHIDDFSHMEGCELSQ